MLGRSQRSGVALDFDLGFPKVPYFIEEIFALCCVMDIKVSYIENHHIKVPFAGQLVGRPYSTH